MLGGAFPRIFMPRTPVSELAQRSSVHRPFSHFARWISGAMGHPATFAIACTLVLAWGVTGPLFDYSSQWQLIINTLTTIATFLMVFLIQNTQNRDSVAMQIKLDELIRASENTHNALLDLEELTEQELNQVKQKYEDLASKAREELRKGRKDTGIGEI